MDFPLQAYGPQNSLQRQDGYGRKHRNSEDVRVCQIKYRSVPFRHRFICLSDTHVCRVFFCRCPRGGRGIRVEAPPVGLSFWRWFLAAFILLPFIYPKLKVNAPVIREHIRPLSLLGCLMMASTTLMLVGLNFTTAINTSIINATQPVFTVLLAMLFMNDRLRLSQISGVALGLIGVIAMIARMDLDVLLHLQFNGGDILILLGSVGYALYAINIKKIPKALSTSESLFIIIVSGCLILTPVYIIETIVYKPLPLNATTLTAIVGMSLAASVLGMLMWNRGIQIIGPSRAGMFINLIPIFATIMAIIFLDERLHLYHVICAVLIAAGIFLVLRQGTQA